MSLENIASSRWRARGLLLMALWLAWKPAERRNGIVPCFARAGALVSMAANAAKIARQFGLIAQSLLPRGAHCRDRRRERGGLASSWHREIMGEPSASSSWETAYGIKRVGGARHEMARLFPGRARWALARNRRRYREKRHKACRHGEARQRHFSRREMRVMKYQVGAFLPVCMWLLHRRTPACVKGRMRRPREAGCVGTTRRVAEIS